MSEGPIPIETNLITTFGRETHEKAYVHVQELFPINKPYNSGSESSLP